LPRLRLKKSEAFSLFSPVAIPSSADKCDAVAPFHIAQGVGVMSAAVRTGYKQTEVGVIPEDWDVSPIEHEVDLLTGFPFPSSGYSHAGIRLLRGSNVKRGATDWSVDITQYWPFFKQGIARYELKVGDLVIAMDGSLVGRSAAQLSAEDIPALLLQRVARIRCGPRIDAGYLAVFVKGSWFESHANNLKTVTAIPHISPADIRSFVIPIPPQVAEQRAIATALSDVDALLGKLDQLIVKKSDLKQAAMQQLLTGKRRLQGFSGEWEVKRLDSLADIRSGGTPSTSEPKYWNGEVSWCTPTDITGLGGFKYLMHTTRNITAAGLQASSAEIVPVGSIVMTSRATIGECAINSVPMTTNQGFKNFIPFLSTHGEFLFYLLQTKKQDFIALCSGSTFLEIGKTQLVSFEVRVPLKPEQAAIATLLSDIDADLTALEARRDKTRALKQGMMQVLLTGQIRLV
jgi:type I restriction enzyme, S subunit